MDRNGYKRHTHRGKYFFRAFLLYLFLVVPVTLQAASFSVNSLLANVNSAASGFWCGTLNFITVPLGFCREVEPTVVISPNETQTDEAQELITLSSSSPDSPNISTTTFATTTSIVISETPTYITNEYITNEYITNPTTIIREIVKETVRAGDKSSSLNTSKFVTRDLLYGQADAIYDSQSNSFANIAESFTTDLLAVSGNATVSGTLTVTGDLTSSGLITGSLRPIDDIDMSGYILTNIGNIGTAFTSSGGLNLAGNLGVNGLSYTWPLIHGDGVLSNNGTGALAWQTLGAASITSDSLDFSEFKDALTLDASTDIAITGSNVFSLTNTGTGLSFRVNDEAGDTTPFVIDGMGKVGIGTTTPSGTLTIQGTAGTNPFTVASSTGSSLLTLNSSGRLVFGTSTTANIFLNGSSSSTPVANSNSIAIGNEALTFTSTSSAFLRNIALGYQALYGSSTNLMTGSSNFAVGYQSLYSNTTGSNNNAFGVFSLYSNTTGLNNNALGQQSLYSNTTGLNNNALGNSPLYFNTTGSNNNALGYQSLFFNTTGSNNNALGYQSLLFNTTGSNNTAIGNRAGFNHTTGTSTTYLGAFTNTTNGAVSSSTAIGAGALLSVSNSMVLGGTGANAVDIVTGTSIPWAKFSIMNNFGATSALFDIATTTSAAFATSSLFRVNANGNVGIGTTTPSQKLDIAAGNMRLDNTTFANRFGVVYKGSDIFMHDFNYGNNGTVTTEGENTFLGIEAGNLTMGSTATLSYQSSYNTGIGYRTLNANTTGRYNTAIGNSSLRYNTTGHNNSATGMDALSANTTGYSNSVLGSFALRSNTTGSQNIAIGSNAGRYHADGATLLTDPENSIYLGYGARGFNNSDSNSIVIGYNAIGLGANTTVLGNLSTALTSIFGNVGIGTTSPSSKLDVWGNLTVGTSSTPALFVNSANGYVGIGTSSPSKNLSIDGNNPIHFDTIAGQYTFGSTYALSNQKGLYMDSNHVFVFGDRNLAGSSANVINNFNNYNALLMKRASTGTGNFINAQDSNGNIQFLVNGAGNVTSNGTGINYFAGDVGIGTTSPSSKLDVWGNLTVGTSSTPALFVNSANRYVGIGTSSPIVALDVVGTIRAKSDEYNSIVLQDGAGNNVFRGVRASAWVDNSTTQFFQVGEPSGNIAFTLKNGNRASRTMFLSSSTQFTTGAFNTTNVPTGIFEVSNGSTGLFNILASGNVGIGTTSPSQKLDISAGNMRLDSTTFANRYGIIYKGSSIFMHDFNYGDNGTVTTIGSNTFLGTGAGNLTMGSTATNIWEASFNTGIGRQVLNANTTGFTNTAVGSSALISNTTGYQNVAVGVSALSSNISGTNNSALGMNALLSNASGASNSAIGVNALYHNINGSQNIAIGRSAGHYQADGATPLTDPENSIYLGYGARGFNNSDNNSIVIGYNAIGLGANTTVLGNSSTVITSIFGNIGIGTTTPSQLLSVAGTVGFSGLTGSVGAGSLCLSANNEVVYNSGSDACLPSLRETKHDIKTLDITGLDLVSALESVSFVYNQSDGRTRYGFIAEDVASIDALLATYDANGNISGIDDRSMIAVIIKAVQELYQSVKELKGTLATVLERLSGQDAQVAALEARILMLESALDIESELAEEGESDTSVIPNNPTSDDQATSSDPVEPEPAPEPELDTEIEPESDTQSEPEPTPPNEEPEPTSVPAITE